MVDPGFRRGGTNSRSGCGAGGKLSFGNIFAKKCMKMKEIELRVGASLALSDLLDLLLLKYRVHVLNCNTPLTPLSNRPGTLIKPSPCAGKPRGSPGSHVGPQCVLTHI